MSKKDVAKSTLDQIFSFFKIAPQVDIAEGEENLLDIKIVGDNISYLIGYRGQALDALGEIVTHAVFKQTNEWPNLVLDVNGYNQQRVERLHNLSKRFIDRVRFFQTEVEMPFMNAWERKQIHTYVSEYDDVASESRGNGKNRKLYLLPKKRKI